MLQTHSANATGQRYAQERQQWEHDRSDWEHWRGRLQEDLEAARAVAGMDLRKGMAVQLAEADSRAGVESAGLERSAPACSLCLRAAAQSAALSTLSI